MQCIDCFDILLAIYLFGFKIWFHDHLGTHHMHIKKNKKKIMKAKIYFKWNFYNQNAV